MEYQFVNFEGTEELLLESGKKKLLGVAIAIGNKPLVRNIKKIVLTQHDELPASLKAVYEDKDLYCIVHSISAIRVKGNAKVNELQYFAEAISPEELQTQDLIPKTEFTEHLSGNFNIEGGITSSGNILTELPKEIAENLSENYISLGADVQIQLSQNANFVGKFTFASRYPITQSAGIASNTCHWVLDPKDKPLLGDQLLIQIIAVPSGTKKIEIDAYGVIKAGGNIFWKEQSKKTKKVRLNITLD